LGEEKASGSILMIQAALTHPDMVAAS